MKTIKLKLMLVAGLISLFLVSSITAAGNNIFVGDVPSGETGASVATIQEAVDMVQPGDTIYVRGGNYHEEVDMIGLTGTMTNPITITNWNDEAVTLDGSRNLDDLGSNGWTVMGAGEGHPNCAGNCYKTTIDTDIWQLWVDGKMGVVARWPNVTVDHPTDEIALKPDKLSPVDGSWWDQPGTWGHMENSWNMDAAGETSVLDNHEIYHDLAAEGVSFEGDSVILNYHSETQFSRPILSHSAGSNTMIVAPVINPHDQGSGYFLVESKMALDMAGEWYYDMDTGEVWLWTEDGQDPTGKDVRGKTQSYTFDFTDAHHLIIDGFTFFGTTVLAAPHYETSDITINDNRFLYPTWYRRMLGEHGIFESTNGEGELKHGSGVEVGATQIIASNLIISNNVFGYSESEIDLVPQGGQGIRNVSNNLVTNNLFHHFALNGMAPAFLMMNKNIDSEQSYNTFHTGGGQTASKHNGADVLWSEAYHFGYFKQDGVAWQSAGSSAAGIERHHLWVHDAYKTGVRWDGNDGTGGTDHHLVGVNTPGLAMLKGDEHKLFHSTGVLETDGDGMLKILDDNQKTVDDPRYEERNQNTRVHNNVANGLTAYRHEYVPLNGINSHNWNGYLHTDYGDTAAAQLRDPRNLDFRPMAGSDLIDAGMVITDLVKPFVGSAPDIGAYEYGDTFYWIPGYRAEDKARTPVPVNGTTTAQPDADLMFLSAREAVANNVYFGTDPANLALIAGNLPINQNIVAPAADPLDDGQIYLWRVDTVLADGSVVAGDLWNFSVEPPLTLDQAVFTATEDVSVRSDNPDKNYEGSDGLEIATQIDGSSTRYSFIKFADVTVDGEIASATLYLHRKEGGSSIRGVEVYSMSDASWDAVQMTWNNMPAIDGTLLETDEVFGGQWKAFDVTAGVAQGDVSLGIKRELNSSFRSLDSIESGNAPYIVIQYGDAPPSKPLNAVATGTDSGIQITWDANPEADIAGYNIFRRQNPEDFFVAPLNSTLLTSPQFLDTTMLPDLPHEYVIRAVDASGLVSAQSASAFATFTPPPVEEGGTMYISSSSGGEIGGVSFADEDILMVDTAAGTYSLYFDGSDVGLDVSSAHDVAAFHIMDDGSILVSLVGAVNLADVGDVDDSDILRFVPTSLGDNTAGTFELYFDGSDVELTRNGEDIDALIMLDDGSLVVSTVGSARVTGDVAVKDEDLLRFIPTSLGADTSGTWSVYFDGSDVGLNTTTNEDVWGASLDAAGTLNLTTKSTFDVAGLAGEGADVIACSGTTGVATSCDFGQVWNGVAAGYGTELMDGLHIGDDIASNPATNRSSTQFADEPTTLEDFNNRDESDGSDGMTEAALVYIEPITFEPVPLAVRLQAAGVTQSWPLILLVVGVLMVGSIAVVGRADR